MIRAFSRWLFMRTHRAELVLCASAARGVGRPPTPMDIAEREGVLFTLETLELLT